MSPVFKLSGRDRGTLPHGSGAHADEIHVRLDVRGHGRRILCHACVHANVCARARENEHVCARESVSLHHEHAHGYENARAHVHGHARARGILAS